MFSLRQLQRSYIGVLVENDSRKLILNRVRALIKPSSFAFFHSRISRFTGLIGFAVTYLYTMCIAGPRMSSGLLLASLLVSGNYEDDQLRQVPQQGFPHPSAAGLLRAPSSPILAIVVLFAAPYVAAP